MVDRGVFRESGPDGSPYLSSNSEIAKQTIEAVAKRHGRTSFEGLSNSQADAVAKEANLFRFYH